MWDMWEAFHFHSLKVTGPSPFIVTKKIVKKQSKARSDMHDFVLPEVPSWGSSFVRQRLPDQGPLASLLDSRFNKLSRMQNGLRYILCRQRDATYLHELINWSRNRSKKLKCRIALSRSSIRLAGASFRASFSHLTWHRRRNVNEGKCVV